MYYNANVFVTTLSLMIFVTAQQNINALMLLSDVPTPSFIIDMQALRRIAEPPLNDNGDIPSIRCPKNNLLLQPISNTKRNNRVMDCQFPTVEGQQAIGYLHTTVTRGRDDAIPDEDEPISTFLAEVDLDPTLCRNDAHLVLGLNNHHVGSYYWARSAGAGSSMEAPGVGYGSSKSNSKGVLRWLDEGGPTACNSNDGKRSEWVNFLRRHDTVQLLPNDGQDTLLEFYKRQSLSRIDEDRKGEENTSTRIFGISNEGRPMGSEPAVVCEWRCILEEGI
ncbi:hypothetical protein QTG54_012471 [Skeletonema marinoi]|uniref:Uncharacterized protein n=1 Tax=Skeletonema marinoi TaxID=267567 RepID=A0AAD8Y166_9STRA|nr:hypothetical protein QTG54_012471 [Skeletonema marinoi]